MTHDRVRAIRASVGMTSLDFSDFLGVSDKTLWLWESRWGQRPRAPMPLLLALIEAHGLSYVLLPHEVEDYPGSHLPVPARSHDPAPSTDPSAALSPEPPARSPER